MLILGLNAYHADSAACLFRDGKIVAAAEEERFRRIKHWAGLPTQAIDYCLREGGVSLGEIEHIAINRQPGVNNWRRLQFVLTHRPDPRLMLQKIRNIRSAASVKDALEEHYKTAINAEVHHVEHHLAHLASAFLVSGFEEAACISIDGFGDFASTAMGWGSNDYHRDRSTRLFPALVRDFLFRAYPVHRFPALRRRIQSHGTRSLWRTKVRQGIARRCAHPIRRNVPLEPEIFPPSHRQRLL